MLGDKYFLSEYLQQVMELKVKGVLVTYSFLNYWFFLWVKMNLYENVPRYLLVIRYVYANKLSYLVLSLLPTNLSRFKSFVERSLV